MRRAGSHRGDAARASHGLSTREAFLSRRRDGTRYDPQAIEAKWQRVWEDERAFHDAEPGARRRPTSATGTSSRCSRTRPGRCTWATSSTTRWATSSRTSAAAAAGRVLRPMGYDSFGLPAENAAIREGGHPREITERNIVDDPRADEAASAGRSTGTARSRRTSPTFYRWTQWLFLKFFERGLAYRKAAPVNWCPNDQTVLANEQVDRRPLRALRRRGRGAEPRAVVLQDHRRTPTSCCVRAAAGRRVARAHEDDPAQLDRPSRGRRDPVPRRGARRRHPRLHDAARHAVRRDVLRARARASARRAASRERRGARRTCGTPAREARRGARGREEKTGVFTGFYATNPVNGERLPIWVADYVLMDYGTGAIMAVPAHDERDREFARRRSSLPVVRGRSTERRATLVNSGEFDGLPADEAKQAIVESLREQGAASRRSPTACATGASRGSATGAARSRSSTATTAAIVPVPDDELPLLLPEVEDYRPKGMPPLASNEEWMHVAVPALRQGRARARPTRWTRSSTRRGTSCATSTRTTTTAPFDRRLVDYWCPCRPVHRRHRPRDRAPALLALLREGAERHGHARLPRAVRAPLPPGLGADGRHEDVEVEGQRRRARRARRRATAPTRCGSTSCSWARPTRTWSGRTRASRASSRFVRRLWRRRARGRASARRRATRRHAARAQGARDDREGDRRHRAGASSSTRRSPR